MTDYSRPQAAAHVVRNRADAPPRSLTRLSLWAGLAALLLLLAGLGVRLFDLTDQPIDFHPTRQLRGAIIARGMYYEMLPDVDPARREDAISFWISTGQYEPPILERLVAYTYRWMGGENLWVSRVYTSLFWIIGGLAVFGLAWRMVGAEDGGWAGLAGALLALGYYLMLPFALQASRSFQPDPGMVMWIALSVYAIYRWGETPNWKWAVLGGLLGGLAIVTKVMAAYIVGGAALAIVLHAAGFRKALRSPQVWSMALLMLLPSVLYYLGRGGRASEYFASWTLSLSHLLLQPSFYARWFNLIQSLMGLAAVVLALLGVLIAAPRAKALLLGLWGGYLVYGLFLPYQMHTHTYYHLQLAPIVALSLAPVGLALAEQVAKQGRLWRLVAVAVALVALAFPAGIFMMEQKAEDHRGEPAYWQEIAGYLPTDGKIVALTQDYGYRLMYYGWRKVTLWPIEGERALNRLRGRGQEFGDYFAKHTEGKSYFLITSFGQYERQPDLQETLSQGYPLVAEGDGYLIFDLAHPKGAAAP